jgi:hypothetical protein
MPDPTDSMRLERFRAGIVAMVAENDQLGAAARDADAAMVAGCNAEQATFLREQLATIVVEIRRSPIHPDHYQEVAVEMLDQFAPTIAVGLAARSS